MAAESSAASFAAAGAGEPASNSHCRAPLLSAVAAVENRGKMGEHEWTYEEGLVRGVRQLGAVPIVETSIMPDSSSSLSE